MGEMYFFRAVAVVVCVVATVFVQASELHSGDNAGVSSGELALGMSVEELLHRFPQYRDLRSVDHGENDCFYVTNKSEDNGAEIMVYQGEVARFDVRTAAQAGAVIHSIRRMGIDVTVGDERHRVMTLYPQARSAPHPYLGGAGEYFEVELSTTVGAIIEVERGLVSAYRVGVYPMVGFIEGCQ